MLKRIVAGGINHMGRVEKPETLKRAPRYEYNPGNISGATQLWLGVIPINNRSHYLELPCKRRILRNTNYTKEFHTLTWTDTCMFCLVVLEDLLTMNYSKTLKPNLVGVAYKTK